MSYYNDRLNNGDSFQSCGKRIYDILYSVKKPQDIRREHILIVADTEVPSVSGVLVPLLQETVLAQPRAEAAAVTPAGSPSQKGASHRGHVVLGKGSSGD